MASEPYHHLVIDRSPPGARSAPSGLHPRSPAPSEIAAVLSPLLHRPRGARGSAVYVLGLDAFHAFYGARWASQAPKLYEAVESAIAEETASGDLYARADDDSYLVAFNHDSEETAAPKAARIAQRVKHRLVGTSSDLELEIHAIGRRAEEGAPLVLTEVETEASRPIYSGPPLIADGKPNFVYMPIWDAYHKVLSTYGCLAVSADPSGRMRFGHELLPPAATDMERARFDLRSFNTVATLADDLHRIGAAVIVTFPLDYGALGSPRSRERLLEAFRTLPRHLSAVIAVQIANAPDDVPATTLSERIGLIKPYFRAVSLQIRTLDQTVQRFAYLGLHALLYRLSDWNRKEPLDFAQVAEAVRKAKAARLQFAFGGVPDLKMAQALAEAGATYLSGPFLGAALARPANMRRCTLDDLGRAAPR